MLIILSRGKRLGLKTSCMSTGKTAVKSSTEELLHVNAKGKTGSNSLAIDASISSASFVGPSDRASMQSASVDQDRKGIDATAKDVHKAYCSLTVDPGHSNIKEKLFNALTPEIWQSPCTKNYGNLVSVRSSGTDSKLIRPWFTDNDKNDCIISSGPDKNGREIWGGSTGKSMTSTHTGEGKPKGQLTDDQKAPFSKKTTTGSSYLLHCAVQKTFYPDGISHNSQNIRKPELHKVARYQDLGEDSLNTVHDTYILELDKPCKPLEFSFRGVRSTSSFSGSNKSVGSELIQKNLSSSDPWSHKSPSNSMSCSKFAAPGFSFTGARSTSPFHGSNKSIGSDVIQQYLSSPDPWFQIYQFTSWSHSVFLAHVNAPNTYNNNWKIHHDPFVGFFTPSGRLPMNLQKSEPSAEDFQSPRIPEADDYCPNLDKILSVEPSIYHHLFQTPSSNQELNMQKSLPLDYQTTVRCTMDGGIRGLLAEDRTMSTISQYLQMRRKLAQMKIKAVEQRAYSKTDSFLLCLKLADIQAQPDPPILGDGGNESGSSSKFFRVRSSSEDRDGVVEGEEDLEAEREENHRKWLEETNTIAMFEQLEGELVLHSEFTLFRTVGYCSFARKCRDSYHGDQAASVHVTTPHLLWPWWPQYHGISYMGVNGEQLNPPEMRWDDFKSAIDHAIVVHAHAEENDNPIVLIRKYGGEHQDGKVFHIPKRSLTTSRRLDFIIHVYHSADNGREAYDDGTFPLDIWPLYTISYRDSREELLERPNIQPYLEPFEQQGMDEDVVNLLEGNEAQEEVDDGVGSEEEGMEEEEVEENELEVEEDEEWHQFTTRLRFIDLNPI